MIQNALINEKISKENANDRLQSEIQNSIKQIPLCRGEIVRFEGEIVELEGAIHTISVERDALKTQKANKEREKDQARNAFRSMDNLLNKIFCGKDLDRSRDRFNNLQNEVGNLGQAINNKENDINNKDADIGNKRNGISDKRQEIINRQQDNSNKKAQIEGNEADIATLEQQIIAKIAEKTNRESKSEEDQKSFSEEKTANDEKFKGHFTEERKLESRLFKNKEAILEKESELKRTEQDISFKQITIDRISNPSSSSVLPESAESVSSKKEIGRSRE